VEIDEGKFDRRKYHRGHAVGQWMFGGVQRGSNKCFLVPVEKRDKDTLLNIIKNYIIPGTTYNYYQILLEGKHATYFNN